MREAVYRVDGAKFIHGEYNIVDFGVLRVVRLILREIMKTKYLLATLVAASLPLAAIVAEDSTKTETSDQQKEQSSDMAGMKGMTGMKCMMGKGQMMSNLKEQDAELDQLVAEMNSAPADKKVDAVAAVLNKLVQERKAMHEQMQKVMAGMCMCQ